MKSGIYEIVNTTNGKRYVGSSVDLAKRRAYHRQTLRKQTHCNPYLQNAWNKYGEGAFKFKTFFYCGGESLIELEQMALDELKPEYNIARVAGSCLGVRRSDETKAKMSAIMRGNQHSLGHKCSPEERAKVSAALMGNSNSRGFRHTAETRAKVSAAQTGNKNCLGRKLSEETKKKISAAKKGRKHTDEARANMSVAQRGRKRVPHSAETRAKISAAKTGRKLSAKHKASMSMANKGKPWTPARRAAQERNNKKENNGED